MRTIINGQEIDAVVLNADGTEAKEALRADEIALLEKIDATLKANAGFTKTYTEANLVRIDSNRGMADTDECRFYLRYQHKGGITEFWGNSGDSELVDIGKGMVCVASFS